MLTKEDIQLLSGLMDEKLAPINARLDAVDNRLNTMDNRLDAMDSRLDAMDRRLDAIEENTQVTRDVLNEVVKWIDYNFRDKYPFPVDKQIV